MTEETKFSGMSSTALENATGKGWDNWLAVLDAAEATKMTHKEMAQWLVAEGHIESEWWAQTITVGYEQARGMRKVNQKTDGFTFSVTKTMPFEIGSVYEAWADPLMRAAWMPDSSRLEITTANLNKNIRGKRSDTGSYVIASFARKTDDRTQVVVQIERLKSESEVEPERAKWRKTITDLQNFLQRA